MSNAKHSSVGEDVGNFVGAPVGADVVGTWVGESVGLDVVGTEVGMGVGELVGGVDGLVVGERLFSSEGLIDGWLDGLEDNEGI